MRVVAERGLDAVSVRSVARAAGVSAGAVQYYFPTKDALLQAAYRRVIDRVTERATGLLPARSAKEFVRALLFELLPLDEEREAELRVGLAFTARSVVSAPLADLYTEGYRTLVEALEAALALAVAQGEASPGSTPGARPPPPPRWPTGSPGTSSARPERSHGTRSPAPSTPTWTGCCRRALPQALNESPQLQVPVAFGLLMRKPRRRRPDS